LRLALDLPPAKKKKKKASETISKNNPEMVVYCCNPSYVGVIDSRITTPGQPQRKKPRP
jgi:hypothetical protein